MEIIQKSTISRMDKPSVEWYIYTKERDTATKKEQSATKIGTNLTDSMLSKTIQ